jgi:acyl-homoserine-lactone acylase
MVDKRLAGTDGYPGNRFTLNLLKTITLDNQVYSADLWIEDIVKFCAGESDARIKAACHAITTWDRTENLDSPGAMMWRHFAGALVKVDKTGDLFTVPFDVKKPVATPNGLKIADPRVRKAMLTAIAELEGAGIPLDATLRPYQYALKNGEHIPISGGESPGQYNIVFNEWTPGKGYAPLEGGASFMMWMQFTPKGPVGESILTFSQSPNAESSHFSDQTRMWSEKRTKKMLFSEADIAADPEFKSVTICTDAACK